MRGITNERPAAGDRQPAPPAASNRHGKPMRWVRALAAALAALALGVPAAAAPASAAPQTAAAPKAGSLLAPDIARIVNRGELVVAMLGTDTPPFFRERNGELVGTDVELARQIGAELGVPVRFDRSARSFNEVVEVVATGKADLGISKLSRTLARAKMIRFTESYLTLHHGLLLNRVEFAKIARDQPVGHVVRNFSGSIGVIGKSSFADWAPRNFPKAKIVAFPSWEQVLQAVRTGAVAAAYRDDFEVRRILKADPAASLTLRAVTLKDLEDTIAIAAGVQDATLLAFVNQYLGQRTDKLTINKLLDAIAKDQQP